MNQSVFHGMSLVGFVAAATISFKSVGVCGILWVKIFNLEEATRFMGI